MSDTLPETMFETMSDRSLPTAGTSAQPPPPLIDISGEAVAIARRLALSAMRVIGFLPVTARSLDADRALLAALAAALTEFVPGDVGLVGDWRAWNGASSDHHSAADDPRSQQTPRVFRLNPPSISDRARAGLELRKLVSGQPDTMSRLLVDLADYAAPGVLPAALDWMDGVAILVPVRRSRWKRVADLVRAVPAAKQLGVIVLR